MPHKLSPRSTPCVFLGYPSHHRGYRCLDLNTHKIIISRHVTFDESTFPYKSHTPPPIMDYAFLDSPPLPPPVVPPPSHPNPPTTPQSQPPTAISSPTATTPPTEHHSPPHTPIPPLNTVPPTAPLPPSTSTVAKPTSPPSQPQNHFPPTATPASPAMRTRASYGIIKPNPKYNLNINPLTPSPLPQSHLQALKDPNWNKAMQDEYNALVKNNTWVLVPRPSDSNVIRCMWLFRHKHHSDGSLERHKARLVVNAKPNNLVLIVMTPSLPWSSPPPFAWYLVSLSLRDGLFTNLTSKMLSSMAP